MAVLTTDAAGTLKSEPSPWLIAGQGAAALAVGMGIGRFVYTPILPLMVAQAHLTSQLGGLIATANYVGYLAGAMAGIFLPRLLHSKVTLRISIVVVVVTLAGMPVAEDGTVWFMLRLIAGIASALVFMIAVSSMFTSLRSHGSHFIGWAFGGVGAGIALSGILVLILRAVSNWSTAWIASAILGAVLSALAWTLKTQQPVRRPDRSVKLNYPRTHRWFSAVLVSYSLEGIGYIIAGTFLVAAIDQSSPGWIGSASWVLAGVAAVPSSALWAWLAYRFSLPSLLLAALVIQAIGIALPTLFGGTAPAIISALLFGATFLGIGTIALAIGAHLQFPRAVALLTTGYSVGQILGPLIVAPVLNHGYHDALLIGAAIVGLAALAAGILRIRFPRKVEAQAQTA
jgi:predicted MFS family arabinose efflux permease